MTKTISSTSALVEWRCIEMHSSYFQTSSSVLNLFLNVKENIFLDGFFHNSSRWLSFRTSVPPWTMTISNTCLSFQLTWCCGLSDCCLYHVVPPITQLLISQLSTLAFRSPIIMNRSCFGILSIDFCSCTFFLFFSLHYLLLHITLLLMCWNIFH